MAVYTQTLKEYLEMYADDTLLTNTINRLNNFPSFTIHKDNDTYFEDIKLYDIFIGRFLLREICCESSEQFLRYVNATIDEAYVKYGNEIAFANKMFKKIMKLENQSFIESEDIQIDETNGATNSNYYNPLNSQSDKLQGKVKVDTTIDKDGTITHNRVHVPSYSEFIDDIKKVSYYYNQIVDLFDSCFMSIY